MRVVYPKKRSFMKRRYQCNVLCGMALGCLLHVPSSLWAELPADTLDNVIGEVTVEARRVSAVVSALQPEQRMERGEMEALGLNGVADAVKRFAGTTVRDYGGIGGLKTVSVRSLGAAHTAVSYDGVTVSNCQAGQIDVGRFSLDNVETLSLAVGQQSDLLQPARAYASAAMLDIRTRQPQFAEGRKDVWQVKLSGGSFGYFAPSFRYARRLGGHTSVMVEGDYVRADGIYPFELKNGRQTTTEHRRNSDICTWHAEGNLYHTFADSSRLAAKCYFYRSERGLPGAVILYNPTANERLWDENFFTQFTYDKCFSPAWQLRASVKYNHAWNRYEDTNVKYEGGLQRDVHRQDEYYLSATVLWKPSPTLSVALAQDGAVNTLLNNIDDRPNPKRLTSLTALNAVCHLGSVRLSAGAVATFTTDEVERGEAPADRKKLSPMLALNWRPWSSEAFYLRALYKNTFRVPTFSDLYYRRSGNTALKPEDAQELNLGLTWSLRPFACVEELNLTVDGYYNKVEDKIVAFPSVYVWRMRNYGEVEIGGVDATLAATVRIGRQLKLHINGSYTWQRAVDVTDSGAKNYKDQLPYTPRHSGNGSLLLETPWLHVGYTVMAVGKRYFLEQNVAANEVPSYMEHCLTLSHTFRWGGRHSLRVQGELVNLTDEQYEVTKYYPMAGRSWRVSGSWEF